MEASIQPVFWISMVSCSNPRAGNYFGSLSRTVLSLYQAAAGLAGSINLVPWMALNTIVFLNGYPSEYVFWWINNEYLVLPGREVLL